MTGIMQMMVGVSGGASGPLIPGVTYTFTPYGQTGPFGPTQTQANTYWSAKPEILAALTVTNGVNAILLGAGTYTIDMLGASGGSSGNSYIFNTSDYGTGAVAGGVGARIQATFTLSTATLVYIVVGQIGSTGQYPVNANNGFSGSGGGATYIYTASTPIAIAGGGGGCGGQYNASAYGYAPRAYGGSATTTSNSAWVTSSDSTYVYDVDPTSGNVDSFSAGSWNGSRNTSTNTTYGYGRALNSGSPEGGYVTANPSGLGPSGRQSARDQDSASTTVPREYVISYVPGTSIASQSWGGFGGGGAGYGNYGSGGGGGGYSGGAGFQYNNVTSGTAVRSGGGGGSSYYNATYISGQTITGGDSIYNSTYYGDGYFQITKTA